MAIKGNWGVDIINSAGMYELREKKLKPYLNGQLSRDYRSGCRC